MRAEREWPVPRQRLGQGWEWEQELGVQVSGQESRGAFVG